MAEKNDKKALKLADGSRWEGDWVTRSDYGICCFSRDLPARLELDGTWCFASDALAAIRAKGQDPEYLELMKVREELAVFEQVLEAIVTHSGVHGHWYLEHELAQVALDKVTKARAKRTKAKG